MNDETQRYWKAKHVQEALERITKLTTTVTNVQPTLGNDNVWNYRSKLIMMHQEKYNNNQHHHHHL